MRRVARLIRAVPVQAFALLIVGNLALFAIGFLVGVRVGWLLAQR